MSRIMVPKFRANSQMSTTPLSNALQFDFGGAPWDRQFVSRCFHNMTRNPMGRRLKHRRPNCQWIVTRVKFLRGVKGIEKFVETWIGGSFRGEIFYESCHTGHNDPIPGARSTGSPLCPHLRPDNPHDPSNCIPDPYLPNLKCAFHWISMYFRDEIVLEEGEVES